MSRDELRAAVWGSETHVDFDRGTALANIGRVSPEARIFEVSAKTGEGMDAWCDYLRERRAAAARA